MTRCGKITETRSEVLLAAGAGLRSAARAHWIEVDTGEPWSGGVATVIGILRGKK